MILQKTGKFTLPEKTNSYFLEIIDFLDKLEKLISR